MSCQAALGAAAIGRAEAFVGSRSDTVKASSAEVINPTREQAAAIVLILVLANRKNPVAKSPVFDRGFAGFIAFFRLERDADCYRIVGFASALGRCCKMTS
jgi:hypothetical protein